MSAFSKYDSKCLGSIVLLGIILLCFGSCEKPSNEPVDPSVDANDSILNANDSIVLEDDSTLVVNDTIMMEDDSINMESDPIYMDIDPIYFEPVPDTLFPGSYLPAYPGSYWEYIDSDGVTSQTSVLDEYLLHSYSFANVINPNAGESEPTYVPKLDDGTILYGYKKIRVQYSPFFSTGLSTLLSEELNASSWYSSGPVSIQNYYTKYTSAVDLTVTVNNIDYYPTIEIKEFLGPSTYPIDDYLIRIYY